MVKFDQEKKKYISETFKDLFDMINHVKKLNKELYENENIKKALKLAYLKNKIDEKTYIKEISYVNKRILEIESNILILLGRIKESIRLLVEETRGGYTSSELSKERRIKAIRAVREMVSNFHMPKRTSRYKDIIFEIEKELEKAEKININKKLQPLISESKKRKQKEKEFIIPKKRIINKIGRTEKKIDIFRFFVLFADRVFGDLSDILLDKFPSLYYDIRSYIRRKGLTITPKMFLSVMLLVTVFSLIAGICTSILVFSAWAFVIPLLLPIIAIASLMISIEYSRENKRKSIDSNLPFATIHMLSLLQTGIDIEKSFYLLSEIGEYGYLSKEFKRIADLLAIGVSLTDAIVHVRDTTVSERFAEFLDELLLTLKSGRSVKDFLITYSEMQLALYRADIEKLNQTMKTFSDLYVGIVLTVPMIFISIAVMLATISEKIFGMSLSQFLNVVTLVLIPVINIGFLIFISKLET